MFGKRPGFIKFRADVTKGGNRVPAIVFCRGGAVGILVVLYCSSNRYVLLTEQPRAPVGCSTFLEIPAGMLDGDGHFAGVAAAELREEAGLVISGEDLRDLTSEAFHVYRPTGAVGGIGASTKAGPRAGASSSARVDASTYTATPSITSMATKLPEAVGASGEVHPDKGVWRPRGAYPSAGGCDEFLRLFSCERSVSPEQLASLQGRLGGISDEQIQLRVVRYEEAWRVAPDLKTMSAMFLYERLAPQPGQPSWVEPAALPEEAVADGPPQQDSGDH